MKPCRSVLLLAFAALLGAATRQGDRLISQARQQEALDTTAGMEKAFELATQALATDRHDIGYQVEVNRLRAFAAQYRVYDGQVLRDQGKFDEALASFERAIQLDPASEVAPQERDRVRELIALSKLPKFDRETSIRRPLERKMAEDERRIASALPVPQLQLALKEPLPAIKVNNQTSSEIFLTIGRLAGLRVLFDPEFQARGLGPNQSLDLHGLGLAEALDYVALASKSFWRALSADTIFVTNDDAVRRSAYEEQITKAFWVTNSPGPQEVNDIAQTLKAVTDIRKVQVHPAQGVIVARADADRLALAEKIVADLDKPKAEVIIDVVILSVAKNWSRTLGVALGLNGANANALFSPSAALAGPLAGANASAAPRVPLDALSRLSAGDYSVTLPGAALNALLETRGTKVLDKAELRTIEGQKSTLRIGQKVPYATGSFSPGALGGTSALVNTQFQYFDVGLNIDVVAKVHEPGEVSLHIESDTSSVADRVDLGGVLQPVISQRKRVADVRVKEGEVNFWDIVTQRQDLKTTSGIPGLSQLPGVGRLFTNEQLQRSEFQVLTLLVPHIIRAPDIRQVNLMGLPSGSDQVVRLRYQDEARPAAPAGERRTLELPPGQAPAPTPFGAPAPPPPTPGQTFVMPPAPNADAGPRLYFSPSPVNAALNATFTVDLMLKAPETTEGSVVFQYDTKTLRLVSSQPGSAVAPAGIKPVTGQPADSGTLSLPLGRRAAGVDKLASFTFQAITAGSGFLAAVPARLVDPRGAEVPAQPDPALVNVAPAAK